VNAPATATLLKGAHVIDPSRNIDRIADVAIADGKICDPQRLPANAQVIDAAGSYVTPGWIDLHVHVYGTLGFADPDSIGIYQGVTSYVEAGGPGIGTMDEFLSLLEGKTVTSLYAGPFLRPMGILGLSFIESEVRSLTDVPIADWIDFHKAHPGLLRYLKVGSMSGYGAGVMKLAKGLAEILALPLYAHIGEHQLQPGKESAYDIYRVAEAGDIVTHIYHGNQCGILDADGKVLPLVRQAKARGILFDVGFGGYNFSWDVAEAAYSQDFLPDLISSDLQQFNVLGPCYSLANVMTCILKLGMPLPEVVNCVTSKVARALGMTGFAGSLKPGMPADVTVFRIESGAFELADTRSQSRMTDRRLVPTMAFKAGVRVDCEMERCRSEQNWLLQFAEDHVPDRAKWLSSRQRGFLTALATRLAPIQWDLYASERLDYQKALELQRAFHEVRLQQGLPMGEALTAVFDSLLDHPFTMQVGLFLLRVDRSLVLKRLSEVGIGRSKVA